MLNYLEKNILYSTSFTYEINLLEFYLKRIKLLKDTVKKIEEVNIEIILSESMNKYNSENIVKIIKNSIFDANIVLIFDKSSVDIEVSLTLIGEDYEKNFDGDNVVLINPLAPIAAKTLYKKSKSYIDRMHNDFFMNRIENDIEIYKDKRFINIDDKGILHTLKVISKQQNINVNISNIRILPEILEIFEYYEIDPMYIDGIGSYIYFCDDNEIEELERQNITYDVIGYKSDETKILRDNTLIDYLEQKNNILNNILTKGDYYGK